MQRPFVGILGERLDDSDRQAILGAIKTKDVFACNSALFLFPLKNLFHTRMLDDPNSRVVIEKPLDHIRNRIHVDSSASVSLQRWKLRRCLLAIVTSHLCHSLRSLIVIEV